MKSKEEKLYYKELGYCYVVREKRSKKMNTSLWPELPLEGWQDTYATLHMWTQIIGKIRLVQTPLINHWWNVPLYVTTRGLTTSMMPYKDRAFQIDFDFIDHQLF